jgi:hypothetical protein
VVLDTCVKVLPGRTASTYMLGAQRSGRIPHNWCDFYNSIRHNRRSTPESGGLVRDWFLPITSIGGEGQFEHRQRTQAAPCCHTHIMQLFARTRPVEVKTHSAWSYNSLNVAQAPHNHNTTAQLQCMHNAPEQLREGNMQKMPPKYNWTHR